jgi:hypothetical protein
MDFSSEVQLSESVADLKRAGFVRVGRWLADGETMRLDGKAERSAGVYAYVVDGDVRYVGSAQRGLHRRLRHYVNSKTMRTSTRIRTEIVGCLSKGSVVEVFALVPPSIQWKGLPVDLVAGLEEGLIRSLRPAWNRRSNGDRIELQI